MLRNYFIIAVRNLFRQKGYSLINILGLSVGLTVSLLIFLWVQDEKAIDQFHKDGDRIYRVLSNVPAGGEFATWGTSPFPLFSYLPNTYPEIEEIAAYDYLNKKQIEKDDKEFLVDGIFATASFFNLLSFPFLEGKSRAIFEEPKSIVISEDLAAKVFGPYWQGQTIGETLSINGKTDFKVTGVFKTIPNHSSITFDFVLNLKEQREKEANGFPWGNFDSRFILKLKEGVAVNSFASKMEGAINDNNEYSESTQLILQAFGRQYLYDHFENGKEAGGRIEYVRLFGIAAFFLLLIACINFMNLATAKASKRAKEVGVRKTIGASRQTLVAQFMIEAGLITFISVITAIILGEFLLGYFHDISGKELAYSYSNPNFWILVGGIGAFTALLAGSYPAFFLSSFRIANVLKGRLSYSFGANNMRRGLVVFQFVLSVLLIVSAFVVQKQVHFISNKHLGLDKENVLYFRTPPGASDNLETFKSQLLQTPGINEITFTSTNPLSVNSLTGDPKWEGMNPDGSLLFKVIQTDPNFLKTMNIPLKEGRNFSALRSTDTISYFINETAAKAMELENPLGKQLDFWGRKGPIVGLVKDFHIGSLHEQIGPLIISNSPKGTRLTMLRIDPKRTEEIIAATRTTFNKHAEGYPFRFDFLDDRYLEMYKSEQRTGKLSGWFALVALFISSLGLLGLSAFIAEQKTKEIGIRKVLGASIYNITTMLSKDFMKLVAISLLFALPIGWYLMRNWLNDFAYHMELSWPVFALAGGVAVFVALVTVSVQSVKAAIMNPVESLRSE